MAHEPTLRNPLLRSLSATTYMEYFSSAKTRRMRSALGSRSGWCASRFIMRVAVVIIPPFQKREEQV
jgi:hypothetical protein